LAPTTRGTLKVPPTFSTPTSCSSPRPTPANGPLVTHAWASDGGALRGAALKAWQSSARRC
jgi:hypothetical protein